MRSEDACDVGHGQRAGLCPLGHSSLFLLLLLLLLLCDGLVVFTAIYIPARIHITVHDEEEDPGRGGLTT